MLTVEKARADVDRFLSDTVEARWLSERCRDYYDHKQWTDAQEAKLRARGQAPITVNRVRSKVEGLVGLYNMRKTDPKAYPRTQAHEDAAHSVTDALRYVADNVNFDETRLDVAEEFFVEGYAGAIVDVQQKRDEVEINVRHIPWDRIYFDSHSRRKDFSDARRKGVVMWMDADEAKERFPGIDPESLSSDYTDETLDDRPRWVDSKGARVRVALHFYVEKAIWHMCAFSGGDFLVKPQPSPFLDEDGDPACPIELVSANVDRDNNRYGEVRGFLDQQDEINHRRSKFLHAMSSRQTFGRRGAVTDIPAMKREISKVDGHVEFEGDEYGKDFGIIPTGDMSRAQIDLYMDAKAEMDAVSFNAQLAGERQSGDLSGKAIDRLQQAGTIELNRQYAQLSGWENRIYRQIWARIKQFWGEEKWIRVTDDHDDLRWVGFNQPITLQQSLEETINDEAIPTAQRQQAAQVFMQMMQAEDPRLQAVTETRNPIPEIDMDIVIDQSFDVMNVQQEQFQMLAQFAQGSDIDILELIELSEIRGKEDLIAKIEKRRAAAAEAAGSAAQLDSAERQAKVTEIGMRAAKTEQEAIQKKVETHLIMTQPDLLTNVAI